MRTGITFDVTAADRARLEAIIAAPTSAQKHVWRAKIILMSGDGLGTFVIMYPSGERRAAVIFRRRRRLPLPPISSATAAAR